jgi:hypothetical protein
MVIYYLYHVIQWHCGKELVFMILIFFEMVLGVFHLVIFMRGLFISWLQMPLFFLIFYQVLLRVIFYLRTVIHEDILLDLSKLFQFITDEIFINSTTYHLKLLSIIINRHLVFFFHQQLNTFLSNY